MLLLENEQDKAELTDEMKKAVENVCKKALETEGFSEPAQISVTFTDDEKIRDINREYRNIDSPTDVLSFPMLEFDENMKPQITEFDRQDGEVLLGDIVISLERAKAQADSFGHSLLREVAFLTAHSMLHLLGYDHMTEPEERIMFEKQESILRSLGITRE